MNYKFLDLKTKKTNKNEEAEIKGLLEEFKKEKMDMTTADKAETKVEDWVSTGNLAMNKVISNRYLTGGFPTKRGSILTGLASSGKTLVGMMACISCQRKGGVSLFIDTEGTYSESMYNNLGGNSSTLLYKQKDTIEDCFDLIEKTIEIVLKKSNDKILTIVWDSVGNTPTNKYFHSSDSGDKADGNVRMEAAWKASVIKKRLSKIDKQLSKAGITLIILNTLVDNMAKTSMFVKGDAEVMPGGKQLKFFASVTNKCFTKKMIYADGEDYKTADPVGITGLIKNTKNKVSAPFRKSNYELYFDKGVVSTSGFFENLCWNKLLVRKTTKSKEWEMTIKGREPKELLLGSKDDAPWNFLKEFIKDPECFFEEDDWDETLIKDVFQNLYHIYGEKLFEPETEIKKTKKEAKTESKKEK